MPTYRNFCEMRNILKYSPENEKFVEKLKNFKICARIRNYTTTVDSKEILHFNKFANDWWDELGTFKPLHSMNKLRIPLVRDAILSNIGVAHDKVPTPKPLKGLFLLDVGCAGGIVSEPLARLGAKVIGLDPNAQVIEKLQLRNRSDLKNLSFVHSTIEEHAKCNKETYDAIVASEVIEHVTNKRHFIKSCIQCLKPRGSLFLTTINKSLFSKLLFITLAEDIAAVVPRGTHEYEKFISPQELQQLLLEENCKTVLIHGMVYNFLTNNWTWCARPDLGYCLHAVNLN